MLNNALRFTLDLLVQEPHVASVFKTVKVQSVYAPSQLEMPARVFYLHTDVMTGGATLMLKAPSSRFSWLSSMLGPQAYFFDGNNIYQKHAHPEKLLQYQYKRNQPDQADRFFSEIEATYNCVISDEIKDHYYYFLAVSKLVERFSYADMRLCCPRCKHQTMTVFTYGYYCPAFDKTGDQSFYLRTRKNCGNNLCDYTEEGSLSYPMPDAAEMLRTSLDEKGVFRRQLISNPRVRKHLEAVLTRLEEDIDETQPRGQIGYSVNRIPSVLGSQRVSEHFTS